MTSVLLRGPLLMENKTTPRHLSRLWDVEDRALAAGEAGRQAKAPSRAQAGYPRTQRPGSGPDTRRRGSGPDVQRKSPGDHGPDPGRRGSGPDLRRKNPEQEPLEQRHPAGAAPPPGPRVSPPACAASGPDQHDRCGPASKSPRTQGNLVTTPYLNTVDV